MPRPDQDAISPFPLQLIRISILAEVIDFLFSDCVFRILPALYSIGRNDASPSRVLCFVQLVPCRRNLARARSGLSAARSGYSFLFDRFFSH